MFEIESIFFSNLSTNNFISLFCLRIYESFQFENLDYIRKTSTIYNNTQTINLFYKIHINLII